MGTENDAKLGFPLHCPSAAGFLCYVCFVSLLSRTSPNPFRDKPAPPCPHISQARENLK
jgi:hypothetical protein